MKFVFLIIYALLSVSGVVCFKLGSTQELLLEITKSSFSLRISWLSVLGLAFYVMSFLMYMGFVAKYDLSYLVPVATGIVYLLTLTSAVVVFKEPVQIYQLVGSALILIGILLMNYKK